MSPDRKEDCLSEASTAKPERTDTQFLESLKYANGPRDVYLELLRTHAFPESPQQLPEKLFLPPVLVGQFEELIIATMNDHHENSQLIAWNSRKRGFIFGKKCKGTNNSVGRSYTGIHGEILVSRPIIHFHSHPNNSHPFFSLEDIRNQIAVVESPFIRPDEAPFIHIVGSQKGIYATLFSENTRDPHKNRHSNHAQTEHQLLRKGYSEGTLDKDIRVLEEKNLGVYHWKPEHGLELRAGDMLDGIELKRLHPSR